MRRLLIASALAVLAAAAAAAQPPASLQPAIERIETMAAAELAKDNVASVTIGVVSGGHLAWTASYGMADMETKTPAGRQTVYRIGSITKQFTALMLLQLAHGGVVKLSDPVEKYFPEVNTVTGRRAGAPPITLVQLATMTSGMGREPDDLPRFLVGPVSQWEQVLIAALPKARFDHEPDTQFLYSNIGYAVLGAALARAAGVPFTSYVRDKIFAPLGMTRTAFEPDATIRKTLSKGYEIGRAGEVSFETPQREHEGRGFKVPNGAIYTTVDDLAKFVAFMLGAGPEAVLPRAVIDDNFTRSNSTNGELTQGYGIGFMLTRRGANVFAGHSGSVAGYLAQAWMHRPSKTGVIVFRNAAGGRFDLTGLTFGALAELAGTNADGRR